MGNIIAKKKSYTFFDIDLELLEKFNKKNIYELYNLLGEDNFRKEEAKILKEIIDVKCNKVISLGGGTLFNKYVDTNYIKNNGRILFIDTSLDIIKNRLKRINSIYSNYKSKDIEEIYFKRYNFFRDISNIRLSYEEELDV